MTLAAANQTVTGYVARVIVLIVLAALVIGLYLGYQIK